MLVSFGNNNCKYSWRYKLENSNQVQQLGGIND